MENNSLEGKRPGLVCLQISTLKKAFTCREDQKNFWPTLTLFSARPLSVGRSHTGALNVEGLSVLVSLKDLYVFWIHIR